MGGLNLHSPSEPHICQFPRFHFFFFPIFCISFWQTIAPESPLILKESPRGYNGLPGVRWGGEDPLRLSSESGR